MLRRFFGGAPAAQAAAKEATVEEFHELARDFTTRGLEYDERGMVQEAEYRAIDGSSLFVLQSVATLDDGEGGELRSVQIQDVSAAKRAEQTLQSLAFGDPLTGLANRMAFEQHLARTLTNAFFAQD